MWQINNKTKGIMVSYGDTFLIPFAITNHVLNANEKLIFTVRKFHVDKRSYKMILDEIVLSKTYTASDAQAILDHSGNVVGSQICVEASIKDWEPMPIGDYKYDLVMQDTLLSTQVALIRPTEFIVKEVLL